MSPWTDEPARTSAPRTGPSWQGPLFAFVIAATLTLALGSVAGSFTVRDTVGATGPSRTAETRAPATATTAPTSTTAPAPTPSTAPTSESSVQPAPPPVPSEPLELTIRAESGDPAVGPDAFAGIAITYSTTPGANVAGRLGPDGSLVVQAPAQPLADVCLTPRRGWGVQPGPGITIEQDARTACKQEPSPPPDGQPWVVAFTLVPKGQR